MLPMLRAYVGGSTKILLKVLGDEILNMMALTIRRSSWSMGYNPYDVRGRGEE
jgi:hypothetical protein